MFLLPTVGRPWLQLWRREWHHGGVAWWVPLFQKLVFVCENCITILDYLSTSLVSSKTSVILTSADVSIFNLAPFWTRRLRHRQVTTPFVLGPNPILLRNCKEAMYGKARKEATDDYEGLWAVLGSSWLDAPSSLNACQWILRWKRTLARSTLRFFVRLLRARGKKPCTFASSTH